MLRHIKQNDKCQKGGGDRMKGGEGINQRTFVHNPGHEQQYGDWLGVGRVWGWAEVGQGRKSWTNCNSISNKKKIKKFL